MEAIAIYFNLTVAQLQWEVVGWTADICFLAGLYLVTTERVKGSGGVFNSLNLAGALLFGAYAVSKNAIPIMVLEIIWGGIALKALVAVWRKRS